MLSASHKKWRWCATCLAHAQALGLCGLLLCAAAPLALEGADQPASEAIDPQACAGASRHICSSSSCLRMRNSGWAS